jgi:hypothetical protein
MTVLCTAAAAIATMSAKNLSSLQIFGTVNSDELLNMGGKEAVQFIGRLLLTLLRNDPKLTDTLTLSLQTLSSWKSIREAMEKFEVYLRPYGVNAFAVILCTETDVEDLPIEGRLELLLRLSSAVQQQRLELSKSGSTISPKKNLGSEIERDSKLASITIPDHFTEEQRGLVTMYQEHLRSDYEHRLQCMYKRLCLLETDYGIPETTAQKPFVPSSLRSLEFLQDKLATPTYATSARSKIVPSNMHRSNRGTLRTEQLDRGGRLDDKERRIPAMAGWKDGGRDAGRTSQNIPQGRGKPRNRGGNGKPKK